MLALFRIVELSSGSISVDGFVVLWSYSISPALMLVYSIDISSIGLRDLRSKIAIIPQDVSHSV